jgi:hypothetical protein
MIGHEVPVKRPQAINGNLPITFQQLAHKQSYNIYQKDAARQ